MTASRELIKLIATALAPYHGQHGRVQPRVSEAEAVALALEERLGTDHVLVLSESLSYYMEHSLACRLAGMKHCRIQEAVDTLFNRPAPVVWPPGRYTVTVEGDALVMGREGSEDRHRVPLPVRRR